MRETENVIIRNEGAVMIIEAMLERKLQCLISIDVTSNSIDVIIATQ